MKYVISCVQSVSCVHYADCVQSVFCVKYVIYCVQYISRVHYAECVQSVFCVKYVDCLRTVCVLCTISKFPLTVRSMYYTDVSLKTRTDAPFCRTWMYLVESTSAIFTCRLGTTLSAAAAPPAAPGAAVRHAERCQYVRC